MEKKQNKPSAPPHPCPCAPRIEALEALVQEQGRQLSEKNRQMNELNLRVQNAAMSFFCDISTFLPPQNVNGPQIQPVNLMEGTGTSTESTVTAAVNKEETTEDFSSQNDYGRPIPSAAIRNVAGAATAGHGGEGDTGTSNATAPIQPQAFFEDDEIETKPVVNADGVIQEAEFLTKKKKRSSVGTVTGTAAGTWTQVRTTKATPTPTKMARKVKPISSRRYRCVNCTASYFDKINLQIHSRIHEKNYFGLGPELKTCGQCGLQTLASEPAEMHSRYECEGIQRNRQN